MKRKIRIGVAGLGRIGWDFHCNNLAGHADFELAAVADTDAGRRAEAEQKFRCRAFGVFDAMLAKGELDAVVIATPTHLHRPMAEAAFKAGLHVLLEKPMAATAADARAIARRAAARKRVLTVYQPHRLAAYYRHMLKLVRDGRIGPVYQVRRGAFAYVRRDDWQSQIRFGGGMLNNYGAHFLDQMLDFTGSKIRRLFCDLRRVATLGDADDVVKIVYETDGGVIADLEINMGAALSPFSFEVYGARGAIRMEKNEFVIRWFDPRELAPKTLDTGLASKDRKYPVDAVPWKEETVPVDKSLGVDVFADFARAIRTGRAPFVPPAQTIRVMEILERCRRGSQGIRDSRH